LIINLLRGRYKFLFFSVPETMGEQEHEDLLALARVLKLRVEVAKGCVATRRHTIYLDGRCDAADAKAE
jgi:hypothetical protein